MTRALGGHSMFDVVAGSFLAQERGTSRMAGPYLPPRVAVIVASVLVLCGSFQPGSAWTRSEDVNSLNGLQQTWSSSLNWGTGDPCEDHWVGVICDASNTIVTQLDLSFTNLNGHLSPAIGGLTGLTILELSSNPRLTGPLPPEIGRLSSLQYLSIQHCSLIGPLPAEMGNLARLTFLGLNNNTINGTLPPSLGSTNLTWLDISSNQISGRIPVAGVNNPVGLDNLTFIQHFHMNNNSFSGSVPSAIFVLPQIQHVLVNFNNLDGTLPNVSSWSNSLTVIRVDGNQLDGVVPPGFAQVPFLMELNLKGNRFSGAVPSFENAESLSFLDLSENNFDPDLFPTWVSSLTNIMTLNLAQINIQGPIPPSIFTLPDIQAVDLSGNLLNGSLTFESSSPELTQVNLRDNNIIGFVGSPTFSNVTNITISLEGNPICRNSFLSLPSSCGGNTGGGWRHPGVQSACSGQLGGCSDGKELNWYTCICAYPLELELLLTAPLFSNLDAAALELERDFARIFMLSENQTFVANMNYLPSAAIEAFVWVFPVEGDNLPKNIGTNITTSLRHHLVILGGAGPYLLKNVFTPGPLDDGTFSIGTIIGIVVGAVVGLLVVAGSVVFAVYHKKRADRAVMNNPFASWGGGGSELGDAPKLKGARWFSLAELKVYTDNWSEDNMIGIGGYGKVYRGTLPTGDLVAVKRATEGSMQGANEFKNEIELLSRVHHRNLVGLVGFCYEGGEQALIYEYMPNGTLTDHLKGRGESPLSWQTRLEIALASALGINYLHDHAMPPIIHRDIKSANILLNEKLVAKVADFGLSKLAPDEGEKLVHSVNVKGTLGYLDPEYYMTQNLTDKSDVYSFGVVLLELLTARQPIDQGKFVVREFRNALDRGGVNALRPLMDPHIRDISTEELEPYLKIALSCVEEDGASRPTTAEIVKQLQELEVFTNHTNGGVTDSAVKKVKFADESENDLEELLSTEFPQTSQENIYQSDPFRYSGAFGTSMTVKPK